MYKIKFIILLICVQISFVQCQTKEEVLTYEVTPEFAKKIDKPEVHFTVDIPKSLKFDKPVEGKKTYSYGMIQEVGKDSIVTEMYSFGYITMNGMSLEKDGKTFITQIRDMLKSGGYEIEEDKIGIQEFDGKKYLSLQAIGTMKEGLSNEFVGRYFFNVIAKPNPHSDTHIIMLMAAKDDQLSNYEDFKDKLTISKVWQSFTYLK
ncbi:hypothetical protein U8527_04275 [Kordia algicida OT-1]|uniref:Uncharacterized protein n=1 Tax=Kordia algicida OT-1 TaxID=391587 RepID=A9DPW4_9FLAO|nr:hypothetical protein [Kordia algicida]EDP97538.1 hypothetical protein KAOT1_20287 [Kordia algicida OT-1]